jgi:hypothetical protein
MWKWQGLEERRTNIINYITTMFQLQMLDKNYNNYELRSLEKAVTTELRPHLEVIYLKKLYQLQGFNGVK